MSQGISRVFVDANVLFGRTQRDWLGLLSTDPATTPFRVYWSEDVLTEALYHLRVNHPEWDGAKISTIVDRVREMWSDGRVSDFSVDGTYQGGDAKDAHVHAAATQCGASYLLTNNLADFSSDEMDSLPYEVYHPDEFFVLVDDVAPDLIKRCVNEQIAYWSTRRDEVDLAGSLRRADCPQFAGRVLRHLQNKAMRG